MDATIVVPCLRASGRQNGIFDNAFNEVGDASCNTIAGPEQRPGRAFTQIPIDHLRAANNSPRGQWPRAAPPGAQQRRHRRLAAGPNYVLHLRPSRRLYGERQALASPTGSGRRPRRTPSPCPAMTSYAEARTASQTRRAAPPHARPPCASQVAEGGPARHLCAAVAPSAETLTRPHAAKASR